MDRIENFSLFIGLTRREIILSVSVEDCIETEAGQKSFEIFTDIARQFSVFTDASFRNTNFSGHPQSMMHCRENGYYKSISVEY